MHTMEQQYIIVVENQDSALGRHQVEMVETADVSLHRGQSLTTRF